MVRYWTCHWQYRLWCDDVNAEFEPIDGSGSNKYGERGVAPGSRVGDFAPSVLAEFAQHPGLLICANPPAHAFHRIVELLLSSQGPVLLV
jgi:hypothetical protein